MIHFQNAEIGYGGTPILSGLDLVLEPGGFYFLTGPSGSGKTTFLRLCTRDLVPQSGSVSFFGSPATGFSRDDTAHLRRRIGVLHQDCRFLDHLSLRDNIALPLEICGKDPAAHAGDIDDLLGWVGLTHRAEALPPQLSGGERQRAGLARALILSPDIVIADEPTGNVDADMGRRMLELMIELSRLNRTILIATHDLQMIRAAKSEIAARVLRIAQGGIVKAGADL